MTDTTTADPPHRDDRPERFDALERRAYRQRDAGEGFLDRADEALALAEAHGEDALRCRALRLRSEALHHAGDTLAALQEVERAVALARRPGSTPTLLARTLLSEAIARDAINDAERATRALIEAIGLLDEARDTELLASCFNSLGVVRSRSGDPEAGLTYYRRATTLRERLGDRPGTLQLLNNTAINLKNLGRYAESLEASDAALALAEALGDATARATILVNRGVLFSTTGDSDEALATFARAEREAERLGAAPLLLEVARRRAMLWLAAGDLERAEADLARALHGARGLGNRRAEQQCLELRSELNEARGDLRGSLDDLRAATALDAALRADADAERLRRLTVGHELELLRRESAAERERGDALADAYRELERLHRRLAEQANLLAARSRTDALTGIPNRAHLDERLREESRRLRRYGGVLAVAMVDVDHFKDVNDRFGHAVGDEALRLVATLLRGLTRETDLVARYGGEEFALLMPESDLGSALTVAAKVLDAIREHPWQQVHPELPPLSVSIGVAASDGTADARAVLRRADEQLMRAKRSGRDQIVASDRVRRRDGRSEA